MSPGETLGSEQSSGGESEQRGKVCCFVMHGSCSHVAEMLHDALPPPPPGSTCRLHAHVSISSKHLETPGNVLRECGCQGDTWKVLEAPP